MTLDLLPPQTDWAASAALRGGGRAEEALWENMKFTLRQNSRVLRHGEVANRTSNANKKYFGGVAVIEFHTLWVFVSYKFAVIQLLIKKLHSN